MGSAFVLRTGGVARRQRQCGSLALPHASRCIPCPPPPRNACKRAAHAQKPSRIAPDCCVALPLQGNWSTYRAKVVRYLRQIAVITPYAQFEFAYKGEDAKNSLKMVFRWAAFLEPCFILRLSQGIVKVGGVL